MLDGIIYAKVAHNTEFEKSRRDIMKAWTNHLMYFCSWRGEVGRCLTQQSAGCSHDNTLFTLVAPYLWMGGHGCWCKDKQSYVQSDLLLSMVNSVLESYFLRWHLLIPHCTSLKQEPGVRCGMFRKLSEQMNTTNECCFTNWICQALEENKKLKAMHTIYQNKCSRAKRIFEESLILGIEFLHNVIRFRASTADILIS